jgi:hypothetical protein
MLTVPLNLATTMIRSKRKSTIGPKDYSLSEIVALNYTSIDLCDRLFFDKGEYINNLIHPASVIKQY